MNIQINICPELGLFHSNIGFGRKGQLSQKEIRLASFLTFKCPNYF